MKPTRRTLLTGLLAAAGGAVPLGSVASRHWARRIGVALGSGSAHGLAHVGVLRVLVERGLAPAVVCGTSSGAIVGALYASGLPIAQLDAVARSFDWQSSTGLTWPSRGLLSNAPLQRQVDAAVQGRRIEQMRVALGIVATDLLDGSRVLLRKGPTGAAVGASTAIPVLFEPVRMGERDLVDGSLSEPVPVDAAREMGAEFVVAVDVAYRPHDERPGGIAGMPFQMMHILVNALIAEQIRRADFVIRIDLHRLMLGKWDADTLIDEGARATREAWPELARKLGRT